MGLGLVGAWSLCPAGVWSLGGQCVGCEGGCGGVRTTQHAPPHSAQHLVLAAAAGPGTPLGSRVQGSPPYSMPPHTQPHPSEIPPTHTPMNQAPHTPPHTLYKSKTEFLSYSAIISINTMQMQIVRKYFSNSIKKML